MYAEAVWPHENTDSVSISLPEVVVRQQVRKAIRSDDKGGATINISDLSLLNRTFGEYDIVNSLKLLPDVEAGSDYGSGIVVNGAEPSQTQYFIDRAPVIFPYRFGGVFSTFNSSHFSKASFSRHTGSDVLPGLGGTIELISRTNYSKKTDGIINVGMTASSVSLAKSINEKIYIGTSARISYIDQLYGQWLKSSNNTLRWSFEDINFTVATKFSETNEVKLSAFTNTDCVGYEDSNYGMDTRMRWTNSLLNLSWRHTGKNTLTAGIYYTGFSNTLNLETPQFELKAPSKVGSVGMNITLSTPVSYSEWDWQFGGSGAFYSLTPQWAVMTMTQSLGGGFEDRASGRLSQYAGFMQAFGKLTWHLVPKRFVISAETGLGVILSETSGIDRYCRPIITPALHFEWLMPKGSLLLTGGLYSQFLHQIGFSELGLASDFWVAASDKSPLQNARTASITWVHSLPVSGLKLETSLYYSLVNNQTEYEGLVMEVIDTDYNPFTHLVISDGYNFGGNIALNREFGNITGGISYSYSSGRRHIKGEHDNWRARHAAGNVVNANIVWNEGHHWVISASFRYSSGRCYTPVNALYLIGGNIAMEYGRRNSSRLPSYQRLDLGGSYFFFTGGKVPLRHIVNVSLLNAYGHRNVEMQYFVLNSEKGAYSLKKLYSLYRFIPSLSYTIEF
ncbi:MAG: hypothetical protein K2H47_03010 [Muribaculaceae bacterium]|nr:hypothetical protein [Muribaculaceae bacterium]